MKIFFFDIFFDFKKPSRDSLFASTLGPLISSVFFSNSSTISLN